MIPNLFLLGAGKCGTSTLYKCLCSSRSIFGGVAKEPHFFSLGFEGRVGNWRTCDFVPNLDLYEENYQADREFRYVLDASASYLHYRKVPERISQYSADPKFIVILRNPVERCLSNYRMMCNLGLENRSLDDVIKYMHTDNIEYLTQGLYFDQLSHYFTYFDREKFHILIYDDVFSGNFVALDRLLVWLDVTDVDKEIILGTENKGESSIPSFPILYRYLKYFRNYLPPQIPTKKFYPKRQVVLGKTTQSFLCDYYRQDIEQLQSLLGVNLGHWSQDVF